MQNKQFKIKLHGNPDIDIREEEIGDTEGIIADKKRYPFMSRKISVLHVFYGEEKYILHNPQNYKFDGCTIPFGLCKGNPKILVPAMFHDLSCENKELVGYNRYVSSRLFKELLILFKVNRIIANIMFLFVDNYQKTQRGWKRNK